MNLAKTSQVVKMLINIFIGFVIFYYLSIFIFIPIGKNFLAAVFPDRDPPQPNFGVLDPIEFTPTEINSANPVYVLNTRSGKLPSNLPTKAAVYRFIPHQFSYEAGRTAQNDAEVLGFTDVDLVSDLTGDTYRWVNKATGSFLEISIYSKDIISSTPFIGKDIFFRPGNIKSIEAPALAQSLLNTLNRFGDPLYINGTNTVTLGMFGPSGVVETKSESDAQIAKVDFYRSIGTNPLTKTGYRILGPNPYKGILQVHLRKPESRSATPTLNYPKTEIHYKQIENQVRATYPLTPISDVWKFIISGNGVIANVTPLNFNPFSDYRPVRVDKILINDVYLAYYEPNKFTQYMQPIYVFEGNYTAGASGGSITIYYPAITSEYIKQPTTEGSSPSVTP